VSKIKWSITSLSSSVLAAGNPSRFAPLAFLTDLAGKLQLVKKLLDKLENLLRPNATDDESHNTLGAIDMFLDTSLQEFTERDEVASRPSEQGA
jgi:hypothetical protein